MQDVCIYRNTQLARLYTLGRSSKSDSAPIRGEAYKPASLQTQQSQRKDVAQLRVGSGGCQNVVGGSEKFSHRMVRS